MPASDVAGDGTLLIAEDGRCGLRDYYVEPLGDRPLGLLVRRICGLDRNAA